MNRKSIQIFTVIKHQKKVRSVLSIGNIDYFNL